MDSSSIVTPLVAERLLVPDRDVPAEIRVAVALSVFDTGFGVGFAGLPLPLPLPPLPLILPPVRPGVPLPSGRILEERLLLVLAPADLMVEIESASKSAAGGVTVTSVVAP
jgi:hypothetical protein